METKILLENGTNELEVLEFKIDEHCYGINVAKKHVRPNPMLQQPGGIVDKEMSIHVSNLAIYDAEKKRATRVSIKTLEDGRKVRVTKVSGTELTV